MTKLKQYNPWLFLVVALMWLLPLVGVSTGTWGQWIATVALALVGIFMLADK